VLSEELHNLIIIAGQNKKKEKVQNSFEYCMSHHMLAIWKAKSATIHLKIKKKKSTNIFF